MAKMPAQNSAEDDALLYPVTQNPLFRVLDALGRDFASHPPSPPPPIMGPRTGQPRSAEEIAQEKGFKSLSDMQCRIAEIDLSRYAHSPALREWYYTDGSKGGLQAMINAQYRFFAPDLSPENP